MGREKKGWLQGAFLLTFAGLISKVLSAGYRIPLQNLTGDVGFYIYQQVYPLLGMAMVLALYGFPSAISHLTAERNRKGEPLTWRHFYFPILLIMMLLLGSFAVLLFLFSDVVAFWIGDIHLTSAYQLVSISFLVIPFLSLLRGVHQGNLDMKPTASSQVGEQLVRVTVIILVAVYVSVQGDSFYRIGEGAAVASIAGGLTACLILLLFKQRNKQLVEVNSLVPWRKYIQTILLLGLVASFNHMLLLLFQFADALTLLPALEEHGLLEQEAMIAKGVLDRGQPLIQLGMVLGSSFALAMIPSISKNKLKTEPERFYQSVRSSIKVSLYLAIGATAGLIAIMPQANILLYQDTKGTSDLRILMLAIVLSAVGVTCATILQGLGMIKRIAVFIVLSVCIKWLGNVYLVPLFGISASAVATVLGLTSFLVFVYIELKRKLPKLRLMSQINWLTLLFAISTMLVFILGIDLLIVEDLSRFGALTYVGIVAVTGACIYLFILLRGRTFTEDEIKMLPFSRLFMRVYKERKK